MPLGGSCLTRVLAINNGGWGGIASSTHQRHSTQSQS